MGWKSILGAIAPLALSAIPGGAIAGRLGSILGTAGKVGSAVAPILGGAAANRAAGQQTDFANEMSAANHNEGLNRRRLGTGARASAISAGPVRFQWGGPGSGLRGETPHFTGGMNAEMDPRMKQLSSSIMDEELQAQLAGTGRVKAPGGGAMDDILAGGAFGSSILGALTGLRKPKVPMNMVNPTAGT